MILKKLQIYNFMCYYGHNEFEFTEGLNVIIGDNGYGKSKLYDAIYWVMYDQCFDTSVGEFRTTKVLKDKLISDKAIYEASVGNVNCSVKLTFYDERNNNTYILERSQNATKYSDNINYGVKSVFKLSERKGVLSAQLIKDSSEIERIKKRILPDNIKPYMWFQGEQINNIIDFKKSETLSQAINILSDISTYDMINELAESIYKTAESEKRKQERTKSGNRELSDEINKKIENYENKVIDTEKALEEAKIQYQQAKETHDNLLSKIDVANEIRELKIKKEQIEREYSNILEEYYKLTKTLNNAIFQNKWIIKGTKEAVESYSNKYSKYQDKHMQIRAEADANKKLEENLQLRLPVNVPEPIYVNQMLEEEKCLVCNRQAKKGSIAYEAIKSLIESKKEDIKGVSNYFSDDYKNLYATALQHDLRTEDIDNDINNKLETIDILNEKKRELGVEYKKLSDLLKVKIAEHSLSSHNADEIIDSLSAYNEMMATYKSNITTYGQDLDTYKKVISDEEKKLSKLVIGNIPNGVIERVFVAETFFKLAKSTRNRVFNNLVNKLEIEANTHYEKMVQDNKSARGIIKFKDYLGNITPELLNSEGKPIAQINTGNMLLIKLATIMAIISARQVTKGTQLYTLIADAPMSSFGQQYTMGFCKVISKVYKQSIIMSKDFYNNDKLSNELLDSSDIKLGYVYKIEPNLLENQRQSRNQLEIKIVKLNTHEVN